MSEQINFDHGKMALKKFNCMICVAESEGRECELDRQVANYCASLQSQLALHDQALDLKNKQLTTALNDLAAANERADGLQRIVDEAREQKPVALVAQHGDDAWSRQLHWEAGADKQAIPAGAKLYAAPVPAQPAVVPTYEIVMSSGRKARLTATELVDRLATCRDEIERLRGERRAQPAVVPEDRHCCMCGHTICEHCKPDAILSTTDTEVNAAPEIFPGTTNALAKLSIKPKE